MIEEVRDESFTDRSDYNNLIDELGLIENEVEVSDKESRDSNVIISELESVGLDFRKKSDERIQSVETVNIKLDTVNTEKNKDFLWGGFNKMSFRLE